MQILHPHAKRSKATLPWSCDHCEQSMAQRSCTPTSSRCHLAPCYWYRSFRSQFSGIYQKKGSANLPWFQGSAALYFYLDGSLHLKCFSTQRRGSCERDEQSTVKLTGWTSIFQRRPSADEWICIYRDRCSCVLRTLWKEKGTPPGQETQVRKDRGIFVPWRNTTYISFPVQLYVAKTFSSVMRPTLQVWRPVS